MKKLLNIKFICKAVTISFVVSDIVITLHHLMQGNYAFSLIAVSSSLLLLGGIYNFSQNVEIKGGSVVEDGNGFSLLSLEGLYNFSQEVEMEGDNIMEEYNGSEYSLEKDIYLMGKEIPFEVNKNKIFIKNKYFDNRMFREKLVNEIRKKLTVNSHCIPLLGIWIEKGKNDFIVPDVCIIDLDEDSEGIGRKFLGVPELVVDFVESGDNLNRRFIYERIKVPE